MVKVLEFLEKLLVPLLLVVTGAVLNMYIDFHIIEYKIDEVIAWKASGERCTKEDCTIMLERIDRLTNDLHEARQDIRELRNK